jgi:hypothetical protein
MLNGSPPPSRPPGPEPDRLDAARGLMRETLGAIRNLEQLLKSIRVGPRALTTVIPDVHESCGPLRQALSQLLEAIHGRLPDAAQAVAEFVNPRVAEIERALRHARRTTMHARERLALEAVVSRVTRELDASRALLELLEAALAGATIRIDLLDLARQVSAAVEGSDRLPGSRLHATIVYGETGDVQANPRVALCLIPIAARLIAVGGLGARPHVTVGRMGPGKAGVTICRGPGEGATVSMIAPPPIGPLLQCAQAAARASQVDFEPSPDGSQITIAWPSVAD